MRNIIIATIFSLLCFGCSSNEEKKDIDWQGIQETRDGLDDGSVREDVFAEVDEILTEWHKAQQIRDHGNIQAAEQKLLGISRGHFSTFIEALKGSHEANKIIAAAALGFSEDIRAIPYLIDSLSDSSNRARSYAAMSIGSIGFQDTPLDKISSAIKQEKDSEVRGMLYFAISRISNEDNSKVILPILLDGLKDESKQVRNHSLITLSIWGNVDAAGLIVKTTLNDDDATIRYNSIRTIGKVGNKTFLDPVKQKLQDSSLPVRKMAAFVVKKWTGESHDVEFVKQNQKSEN